MRGYSKIFWLPLKALVSFEEPVSVDNAPLCYALLRSGGEDWHPQMLLGVVDGAKKKPAAVMFCFVLLSRILMKKKSFATYSRVRKTILNFFSKIFCINICNKVSKYRRFMPDFGAQNCPAT